MRNKDAKEEEEEAKEAGLTTMTGLREREVRVVENRRPCGLN